MIQFASADVWCWQSQSWVTEKKNCLLSSKTGKEIYWHKEVSRLKASQKQKDITGKAINMDFGSAWRERAILSLAKIPVDIARKKALVWHMLNVKITCTYSQMNCKENIFTLLSEAIIETLFEIAIVKYDIK